MVTAALTVLVCCIAGSPHWSMSPRLQCVLCCAVLSVQVPELAPRVVVLLQRALYDNDDEVRGSADGLAAIKSGSGVLRVPTDQGVHLRQQA